MQEFRKRNVMGKICGSFLSGAEQCIILLGKDAVCYYTDLSAKIMTTMNADDLPFDLLYISYMPIIVRTTA